MTSSDYSGRSQVAAAIAATAGTASASAIVQRTDVQPGRVPEHFTLLSSCFSRSPAAFQAPVVSIWPYDALLTPAPVTELFTPATRQLR